mmetsp:Transcript_4570/g.6928  ORF Transcript_4570/g.6928 Transcript_4570/m.6928 type:complete len:88 (+) Transcript_4570:948-1211(+)
MQIEDNDPLKNTMQTGTAGKQSERSPFADPDAPRATFHPHLAYTFEESKTSTSEMKERKITMSEKMSSTHSIISEDHVTSLYELRKD